MNCTANKKRPVAWKATDPRTDGTKAIIRLPDVFDNSSLARIVVIELTRGGRTTLRNLALSAGLIPRTSRGWAPSFAAAALLPTDYLAKSKGCERYYCQAPHGEYLDLRLPGVDIYTVDSLPHDAFIYSDRQPFPPHFPSKLFTALKQIQSSNTTNPITTPQPEAAGKAPYPTGKSRGSSDTLKLEHGKNDTFSKSLVRRIARRCQEHRLTAHGTRYVVTCQLCRALFRAKPLRSCSAADLWEPYVKKWWYYPSKVFTKADRETAWQTFASLWETQRAYESEVELALAKSRRSPLPAIAYRYRPGKVQDAVALFYALADANGHFYMSQYVLGDVLGIEAREANKIFHRLMDDVVIYRNPDRQPWQAYRYRLIPQAGPMTADRLITETLAHGPRPAVEMLALAAEHGIAPATLKRAKKKLRVDSYSENGQWFWQQRYQLR